MFILATYGCICTEKKNDIKCLFLFVSLQGQSADPRVFSYDIPPQEVSASCHTENIRTIRTPKTNAVIILQFEQCGFTLHLCVQGMHTEWH